ncbi:MAG: hypothetical protein WD492_12615 [Alkalispirochaeta sp.]
MLKTDNFGDGEKLLQLRSYALIDRLSADGVPLILPAPAMAEVLGGNPGDLGMEGVVDFMLQRFQVEALDARALVRFPEYFARAMTQRKTGRNCVRTDALIAAVAAAADCSAIYTRDVHDFSLIINGDIIVQEPPADAVNQELFND